MPSATPSCVCFEKPHHIGNNNMKPTLRTFYAVLGGHDFDSLLSRANENRLKDAKKEAVKYKCAEVWRVVETGPAKADRNRTCVFIHGAEHAPDVAW